MNMAILDKKEFYKKMLRDRYPVAKIEFPTEQGVGRANFYATPLGLVMHVFSGGTALKEIKIYDRKEGDFIFKNVFCGENLVCLGNGSYICVSNKLQVQDVIGRKFLIKLEDINVIARAEFIQKSSNAVDKGANLVYN